MKHIPLYAQNLVNICVDQYRGGDAAGRIYHCYSENPEMFSNVIQMVEKIEDFFDNISFPQASTQVRAFRKTEPAKKKEMKKVVTPPQVVENKGELGTFLLHVQYRQNSSWQGDVEWMEGDMGCMQFVSVLELLKIFNNVLEK
jgi:hypothetical protein